jgi:hypothetical protein
MAAFFAQNEAYKWFATEYPLAIDELFGALWTDTVLKSDESR